MNSFVKSVKVFFPVFLLSISLSACALWGKRSTPQDAGIIYGPGFALSLMAPQGWYIDEQTGKRHGLLAVILPENQTWNTAKTRIYSSVAFFDSVMNTPAAVLQKDTTYFHSAGSDVSISPIDTLMDANGRVSFSYEVTGMPQEPYKIITYIPENKVMILLGMGAASKDLYRKTLPQYQQVVLSYTFFTQRTKFLSPKQFNGD